MYSSNEVGLEVIYARNPVDRGTWTTHIPSDLPTFLLSVVAKDYGGHFPPTAKIYQDRVDAEHDITPVNPDAAEALSEVRGRVYVIVWPSGQAIAGQLAIAAFITLAMPAVRLLLDSPDEKVTDRRTPKGSPNNLPGQRSNTSRVLQRIPDIYGEVKATPDLIQFPYVSYVNNLQVETIAAVIGRGEYEVLEENIKEGNTQVSLIPGASLAIYPPFEVPVYGTPQLQIGAAIDDPLLNVVPVKEVNGQQLLAPNNNVIFGDDDEAVYNIEDVLFKPFSPVFRRVSTSVGTIVFSGNQQERVRLDGATAYFTNRLNTGDKFGLYWIGDSAGLPWDITAGPGTMKARGAVSVHLSDLVMGTGGDANIPNLALEPVTIDDDHYEVTATNILLGGDVEYTISIPVSKQAEWAKIALFNPTTPGGGNIPDGTIANRMCAIYTLNNRFGPFFCDDTSMEQVHLNFIAEKGLWVDDGRRQLPYGVPNLAVPTGSVGGIEITIELTPADESGVAIGPKELYLAYMYGSALKRDFVGLTAKITPTFTGRFLVSVYRSTLQYWRTMPRSFVELTNGKDESNWAEEGQRLNNFSSADDEVIIVRPIKANFEDTIKWTHCYGISEPKYYPFVDPIDSFGNVTIVHSKTSQVRFVPVREQEKNLNMIVKRVQPVFSGETFIGNFPTVKGKDAALHVLNDNRLSGGIDDALIDYIGIEQAFNEVSDAFGDATAVEFSHTFDNDQSSFEDILSAIGESCFVTFYRQGGMIKAKADVSQADASILFNHRNMLPSTETMTVAFGTEEDYDGVELEYTDNLDNQVKSYIAPTTIAPPRNMQKIRVAGVRTREKAAMHAWRAANRLLYQNTVIEFDACEEAALSFVKDKILVATGTRPDVMDGDIVRIDGLTVYTSQEIDVDPGQSYTLFIQDVDGTVQSLPVVTDDTTNGLILDAAPSGSLVIDEAAGIYPRYFLVRAGFTLPTAWQVKESQFKNQGVYSITASNYSEGFYFNDGLRLWLPFKGYSMFPPITTFMDRSPLENEEEKIGTPTIAIDDERGPVYNATLGANYLQYEDASLVVGTSYCVAVWIKLTSAGGIIVTSLSPAAEFTVELNGGTGDIDVTHGGALVSSTAGVVPDEWNHVAVNYDTQTEILTTYINGEQEGIAIDVGGFATVLGLQVLNVVGRADDLRVYRVPKNAEFIRELYLLTRKFA